MFKIKNYENIPTIIFQGVSNSNAELHLLFSMGLAWIKYYTCASSRKRLHGRIREKRPPEVASQRKVLAGIFLGRPLDWINGGGRMRTRYMERRLAVGSAAPVLWWRPTFLGLGAGLYLAALCTATTTLCGPAE